MGTDQQQPARGTVHEARAFLDSLYIRFRLRRTHLYRGSNSPKSPDSPSLTTRNAPIACVGRGAEFFYSVVGVLGPPCDFRLCGRRCRGCRRAPRSSSPLLRPCARSGRPPMTKMSAATFKVPPDPEHAAHTQVMTNLSRRGQAAPDAVSFGTMTASPAWLRLSTTNLKVRPSLGTPRHPNPVCQP